MGSFRVSGFIYSPPKIHRDEYENYLKKRDEYLGWGMLKPRPTPAYPDFDKHPSCLSMYGDSSVYGILVSDEDTATNYLSKLLHCRVSNYGVSGYGTDQAYLRFHSNINDKSKIVILGFLTENIFRNVNRYRYCLYGSSNHKFMLKPRFIAGKDGGLTLIPLPKLSYDNFVRVVDSPEKYLEYEYFIPGNSEGIVKQKFPFTFTLIKVLIKNKSFRNRILLGIPMFESFYNVEHPSNGLMVTFLIMKQFCIEAECQNKVPIILIIPTKTDLAFYSKNKKFVYGNLTKMLKDNKMRFIDVGPELIARLNGKNPNKLYLKGGHFNANGNKLLAEIIYNYLKKNNISL